MKAVSIKQPWTSLIGQGIKDIENRTWQTHFRGKVFIHASAAKKFNIQLTDEQTKLALPVLKSAFEGTLPFGAIIGEVDIVDCVINHPSIWAEKSPFCPITGLPFFMEIENEGGVMVRTYGGPFDSYTIPVPDDTAPGELVWDRYCHDRGAWMGCVNTPEKFHKNKENKPIWNWVLANAVLYDEPILNVKGKLSFWDYERE